MADALQQAARVAFRGEAKIDVVERCEPGVNPPKLLDLLGQLVGKDLQMPLIEIGRRFDFPWLDIPERQRDDLQQSFRPCRFAQRVRDAAVPRQLLRLRAVVMRRVEDDRCRGQRRIRAQPADEFVAVHRRHQNVRNHQVRTFDASQRQRMCAIVRLDQAVPVITEQRHQVFAVHRKVVDDQDGRHERVIALVTVESGLPRGRWGRPGPSAAGRALHPRCNRKALLLPCSNAI